MSVVLNLTSLGFYPKTVKLDGLRRRDIENEISDRFGLEASCYYLVSGGKRLGDDVPGGEVSLVPRLRGGKGGFGSMLRAIGAQIEKTTNREACRDLSGRRLRDINEEQRLKKWISQKSEREREAEERRKKRIEKLLTEPGHNFKDEVYESQRSDLTEKLSDSLDQGLRASSSAPKRKTQTEPEAKKKKKKLLLDSDEDLSSSDGSDVEADKKYETPLEVENKFMETETNESFNRSEVNKLDKQKKNEPLLSV